MGGALDNLAPGCLADLRLSDLKTHGVCAAIVRPDRVDRFDVHPGPAGVRHDIVRPAYCRHLCADAAALVAHSECAHLYLSTAVRARMAGGRRPRPGRANVMVGRCRRAARRRRLHFVRRDGDDAGLSRADARGRPSDARREVSPARRVRGGVLGGGRPVRDFSGPRSFTLPRRGDGLPPVRCEPLQRAARRTRNDELAGSHRALRGVLRLFQSGISLSRRPRAAFAAARADSGRRLFHCRL